MLAETLLCAVTAEGKVVYVHRIPCLTIPSDKNSLLDGRTIHTIKKMHPDVVRVVFDIAI